MPWGTETEVGHQEEQTDMLMKAEMRRDASPKRKGYHGTILDQCFMEGVMVYVYATSWPEGPQSREQQTNTKGSYHEGAINKSRLPTTNTYGECPVLRHTPKDRL